SVFLATTNAANAKDSRNITTASRRRRNILGGAVTIWLLSGIGVYASAVMYAKARRAERGLLTEPSVVQTPAARTLAGVPNAAFGLAYYPLVSVGALAGLWINPG